MKKKIYILLIVIFLLFIGTGASNSLLGSAWPAISESLSVPLSWQSILIVLIYIAATIGATTAQNILARFNTFLPVVFGMALIATSIFMFSVSDNFVLLLIFGIMSGYGLGLEQAIINGYVGRHYSATALSWLHCCFSIGCTFAPAVLAYFISTKDSWRMGYQAVGVAEIAIIVILLISIPLWKVHGNAFPMRRAAESAEEQTPQIKTKSVRELMSIPGGTIIPVNTYIYCAFEVMIVFWTTSFLTAGKGMTAGDAAGMMTLLFGAQVAGRIICGFVSMKVSARIIIRVALFINLAATIAFLFIPDTMLAPVLIVLGFATGPIFPMLVHEVPSIVGKENAQGVIGLQFAGADLGNASIPVIFGVVASSLGFEIFPVVLLILIVAAVLLKGYQDRAARLREERLTKSGH